LRVLGVDFGTKRIGIAVGDSELGIASARSTFPASGSLAKDADAIQKLAKQEGAEAVVVGVPLNPEGSDRMHQVCLQLAGRIEQLGFQVFTVDERLSSFEGEENLKTVFRPSAARRHIDAEAARLILERFFRGER